MFNTKKIYTLGTDSDKRVLMIIPIIGVLSYLISSCINSYVDYRISFLIFITIFLWLTNFCSWSWLLKLLGIPCINGKWDVEGVSSFNGNKFNGQATVKQGIFTIDIKIEFNMSTSLNTTSCFYTKNTDVWILYYQYENIPNGNADDDMKKHLGASYINIVKKEDGTINMNGNYVTDPDRQNVNGCINNGRLKFIKEKNESK